MRTALVVRENEENVRPLPVRHIGRKQQGHLHERGWDKVHHLDLVSVWGSARTERNENSRQATPLQHPRSLKNASFKFIIYVFARNKTPETFDGVLYF